MGASRGPDLGRDKLIWRRVPVSYDMILEVSTHSLKVSKTRGGYSLAFII